LDQLQALLAPGTPVVRMDADTTRGKDAHQRLLESFISASHGVLLGTQMIAKGLDFPDVTLVGVLIADTSLKFPDFRAAERTWQLLEQVAGRAGRAHKDGQVIVQTYLPKHASIRAAASHDRSILLAEETAARRHLGYPPYMRMANILIWGEDLAEVSRVAKCIRDDFAAALLDLNRGFEDAGILRRWQVIGPGPCLIALRKNMHRWHLVVKAPLGEDISGLVSSTLKSSYKSKSLRIVADVDPYDMI
jgi:primosomal protein N' (replication factor Y)